WSQGLLFHQAVVDGCRAAILLPLGISIYYCQPVQKCSLVETAFLLLVTVSTVNMLTTVLNDSPVFPNDEEDEMTDLTAPLLMDSPQCVLFGVFMIWFASITINLGPTFLSGALAANSEAGHNAPSCPLVHGPLRHYVLNLLWIIINVICVGLTLFHLHKLHRDLTKANVEAVRVAGLVTTLVSVTGGGGGLGGLSGPTSQGGPPRPGGALDEHRRMRNYLKRMEREGVQRVKMFLVITGAYVLFWGPLFFVTLVHHPLIVSPMGYEITLHVAYVHAFVNPTLFLVLHRGLRGAALDVCCGCCLFLADWILGAAGVDRPHSGYAPHRSRGRRSRPTPGVAAAAASPSGSVDLPPPPHPPASSVSEISLLKQKSSSTTDVGVMTQPIVPIDHPIISTQQT
ncbi:Octopamine receptor Oamb, partial [Frankliniella fusca]